MSLLDMLKMELSTPVQDYPGVLVEDGDSSDPADSRVSLELDVVLNRMRSGEII